MAETACENKECIRTTSKTSGRFCTRCAARNYRQSKEGRVYYATASVKEKRVAQHRLRSFGLSPEKYSEILEQQDGKCYMPFCLNKEDLVVDHCKETMTVRGILCRQCNAAIGKLGDTKSSLIEVLGYITKPPAFVPDKSIRAKSKPATIKENWDEV